MAAWEGTVDSARLVSWAPARCAGALSASPACALPPIPIPMPSTSALMSCAAVAPAGGGRAGGGAVPRPPGPWPRRQLHFPGLWRHGGVGACCRQVPRVSGGLGGSLSFCVCVWFGHILQRAAWGRACAVGARCAAGRQSQPEARGRLLSPQNSRVALLRSGSTAAAPRRAADTQAVVRREVDEGAELIMHVGDISYANGRPEARLI